MTPFPDQVWADSQVLKFRPFTRCAVVLTRADCYALGFAMCLTNVHN